MDFTALFLKVADSHHDFREATEIVKANSAGRIWLIGGFVCRGIIQELYGVPMANEADFDFIVEKTKAITLPPGWRMEENSYGNPKLIGPAYEIDYVPLDNIHALVKNNISPTIENFLTQTPLNVQSIAFDIDEQRVIGEIGIKSIQDKVIAINDREQAEFRAQLKGVTPNDLVRDIAEQFGFTALL